jgi:hypothetical protein
MQVKFRQLICIKACTSLSNYVLFIFIFLSDFHEVHSAQCLSSADALLKSAVVRIKERQKAGYRKWQSGARYENSASQCEAKQKQFVKETERPIVAFRVGHSFFKLRVSCTRSVIFVLYVQLSNIFNLMFNPLRTELNPICN